MKIARLLIRCICIPCTHIKPPCSITHHLTVSASSATDPLYMIQINTINSHHFLSVIYPWLPVFFIHLSFFRCLNNTYQTITSTITSVTHLLPQISSKLTTIAEFVNKAFTDCFKYRSAPRSLGCSEAIQFSVHLNWSGNQMASDVDNPVNLQILVRSGIFQYLFCLIELV